MQSTILNLLVFSLFLTGCDIIYDENVYPNGPPPSAIQPEDVINALNNSVSSTYGTPVQGTWSSGGNTNSGSDEIFCTPNGVIKRCQ